MHKLDFYFILAIIAIFGSAASVFLQFQEASYEYELLSSSLASLVRNRSGVGNINETLRLNEELNALELELESLDVVR